MRVPFTPHGRREMICFGGGFLLAGVALLGALPWAAPLPFALAVFVFAFFRDPERSPEGGPEAAVAPADGRVLWSIAGPGDGETVANPPQVLSEDRVLITFWTEAVMLKIARHGDALMATELWRSPRLRAAYSPSILHREHLFGFNGPFLSCVDAATGDVKWRHRMYEGTIVGAGEHLIVLGRSSGDIQVVQASTEGFTEVARATVLTPGATSMTGPSLAGDRVFVRNSEEIVALAIEGK